MTPTLTLPQIDAAIARLDAQRLSMAEVLVDLDDHAGRKLLEAVSLEGVTCGRWATTRARMETLWAQFDVYGTALRQLRSVRGRRSRPSAAALVELTRLLTAPVVAQSPLPPASKRTALISAVPTAGPVTLDELEKEMNAAFVEVIELLESVDQVWNKFGPQIEHARSSLSALEALASDLGLNRATDPVAESIAGCGRELEAFGALVQTDPLSLWANGKVDGRELVRLTQEIDRASAELRALDGVRTQASDRMEALTAVLAELADLVGEVGGALDQVRRKVSRAKVPELPRFPETFAERLRSSQDLQRRGRWRRLSAVLDDLERDAASEVKRVRQVLTDVRRPLEQRAELRGRLHAYRAKAFQLGRGEDTALEEQYRFARQLLWRSPCDLDAAAAAVAGYQWAVNASTQPVRPRGASSDPVEDEVEART